MTNFPWRFQITSQTIRNIWWFLIPCHGSTTVDIRAMLQWRFIQFFTVRPTVVTFCKILSRIIIVQIRHDQQNKKKVQLSCKWINQFHDPSILILVLGWPKNHGADPTDPQKTLEWQNKSQQTQLPLVMLPSSSSFTSGAKPNHHQNSPHGATTLSSHQPQTLGHKVPQLHHEVHLAKLWSSSTIETFLWQAFFIYHRGHHNRHGSKVTVNSLFTEAIAVPAAANHFC